jgi:hypothetical protein
MKCEMLRYGDATALFCLQSSGRSLRTFSRSRHKTSQLYVELTVWPSRTNFFMNSPLEVKGNGGYALEFAFHLPLHFHCRLVWTFPIGGLLFCIRTITLNPALVTSDNLGQEAIWWISSQMLTDPSRNCVRPDTPLQIKGCQKISTFTGLPKMLYTDSQETNRLHGP